jgi:prophage antirepressor-like protein
MNNTNLQLFNFDGHQVRVFGTPDNPEWVARDVAEILGLSQNTLSERLSTMPEKWKGMTLSHTLGGKQEMTTVKEPGLYQLIFRSRKAEAERFQDWVFEEVLPAIRRTGRYELPELHARRLKVITDLIEIKDQYRKDLELCNLCNDVVDLTKGVDFLDLANGNAARFVQVSIEDAERLSASLQLAARRQRADYYDIVSSLKLVLAQR